MRRRREVSGTLGEPVERGIPVIPERWKLPALLTAVVFSVTVLTLAIVLGLRS